MKVALIIVVAGIVLWSWSRAAFKRAWREDSAQKQAYWRTEIEGFTPEDRAAYERLKREIGTPDGQESIVAAAAIKRGEFKDTVQAAD